jgi:hypothetical protein
MRFPPSPLFFDKVEERNNVPKTARGGKRSASFVEADEHKDVDMHDIYGTAFQKIQIRFVLLHIDISKLYREQENFQFVRGRRECKQHGEHIVNALTRE